jgi:hypothetical protein
MTLQGSETKRPSENQIRLMGKMLHWALVEIRGLGREGKSEQAADLADAFHSLPAYMFSTHFDWSLVRAVLQAYQDKYSLPQGRWPFDYLTSLDRIERGEDDID